MMRRLWAGVLALGLLLATGCGASPDEEAGSPLPSAPPWYSGPYYPAVVEMLDVYQQYFEAYIALEEAGGVKQLPAEFADWLMEPAHSSCEDHLNDMWTMGLEPIGYYDSRIVRATQNVYELPEDAELGLIVCEEYVGHQWYDANGAVRGIGEPEMREVRYSFNRDTNGTLKITNAYSNKVAQCEI